MAVRSPAFRLLGREALGFPVRRSGRRGSSRAFSLIEVVIALGLFAFAIVPLIGLMSQGLIISGDSIQSANLAEIYRHAARQAAETPTASAIDPMYFTYSGEVATNDATRIYRLSFTEANSSDAATGFRSRKVWKLKVSRADNPDLVLDEHFLMLNQDPFDALPK